MINDSLGSSKIKKVVATVGVLCIGLILPVGCGSPGAQTGNVQGTTPEPVKKESSAPAPTTEGTKPAPANNDAGASSAPAPPVGPASSGAASPSPQGAQGAPSGAPQQSSEPPAAYAPNTPANDAPAPPASIPSPPAEDTPPGNPTPDGAQDNSATPTDPSTANTGNSHADYESVKQAQDQHHEDMMNMINNMK